MSATVTVDQSGKVIRLNVEDLEIRTRDLELAVLELANVIERLVVGDKKRWKGDEAKAMLAAIDNARALTLPDDDDPEPEPASGALAAWLTPEKQASIDAMHATAAAQPKSRYWIDLKNGDAYDTDDIAAACNDHMADRVLHIFDRQTREFLVWQGKAESLDIFARAA